MHRDYGSRETISVAGRWAMHVGDHAGDALAVLTRHDQFRRDALIAQAVQGSPPVRHPLVAWVRQLRASSESSGSDPVPGWARGPRQRLRLLSDRLRVVAFPGPAARA